MDQAPAYWLGFSAYLTCMTIALVVIACLLQKDASRAFRQEAGPYCPRCGYAIRTSSECCPECGVNLGLAKAVVYPQGRWAIMRIWTRWTLLVVLSGLIVIFLLGPWQVRVDTIIRAQSPRSGAFDSVTLTMYRYRQRPLSWIYSGRDRGLTIEISKGGSGVQNAKLHAGKSSQSPHSVVEKELQQEIENLFRGAQIDLSNPRVTSEIRGVTWQAAELLRGRPVPVWTDDFEHAPSAFTKAASSISLAQVLLALILAGVWIGGGTYIQRTWKKAVTLRTTAGIAGSAASGAGEVDGREQPADGAGE
jgi:hypothetical protein